MACRQRADSRPVEWLLVRGSGKQHCPSVGEDPASAIRRHSLQSNARGAPRLLWRPDADGSLL
jgi:hypothetical protein